MTVLKCSATNCLYNQDRLCSRGEIDMMGENARQADETCCASFRERGEGVKNSAGCGCGCEEIQIDCKANNCTYNEHCRCTAASIDVNGHGATTSQETSCGSFACQC